MIPAAQNSNQQQVNTTQQIESITGVVERLTYYSEESGYTVARLQRPGARELTLFYYSHESITLFYVSGERKMLLLL
jgi:hypothetical protein